MLCQGEGVNFLRHEFELEPKRLNDFSIPLETLAKFPLERIQTESPLRFLFVNYGIESTVGTTYSKNLGTPKETIKRLNALNVITNHSYLIGLPNQTKQTIAQEITNNLGYGSDLITIITFKPVPGTSLYSMLDAQNRLLFDEIPPEFFYCERYLPFRHEHLGYGFAVLGLFAVGSRSHGHHTRG